LPLTIPSVIDRDQRTAYSAGGIVYRFVDGVIEVAMIATHGGKRWGLPKGHIRRGETAEAAALREIAEETNLHGVVEQHITTIEYWFRVGGLHIHKYVDVFLVRYQHGTIRPQESEVDDAQWIGIDDAIARASFQRERDALQNTKEILG
jgi:8-oxo-dGTP pyrophosphatase MutT (NUDIX family)